MRFIVSVFSRFGFPGLDNIRAQSDYILSYDRRNRVAHWVFEHLTLEGTRRAESVDRQKSAFEEDKSLHPYFRSANSDYKYSGFDRCRQVLSLHMQCQCNVKLLFDSY